MARCTEPPGCAPSSVVDPWLLPLPCICVACHANFSWARQRGLFSLRSNYVSVPQTRAAIGLNWWRRGGAILDCTLQSWPDFLACCFGLMSKLVIVWQDCLRMPVWSTDTCKNWTCCKSYICVKQLTLFCSIEKYKIQNKCTDLYFLQIRNKIAFQHLFSSSLFVYFG